MRATLALTCLAALPRLALGDEPSASACVEALEQVATLQDFTPVYKQLDGGERHYLDDALRPAELARLQKLVSASCSADPKVKAAQQAAADRLHLARSPECAVERDKLAAMEQPNSHDPPDSIRQQRALVAAQCPTVPMRDVWLLQMVWARPAA